ncbi:AbrB/MazE/SpoVT family DNA-binding domain-containing protein [bacterium]|nr:AbrB/MazE/SpoVT family DNA-binding domain-containing protein [bacterium]MBU1599730.1 AbrB/MazE/SpoVT family DNA-binding domain-containing protein [bacterium]
MIRQPNTQGQITIPKEYLKKLGFSKNDYFDVTLKDTMIILQPVTVEPKFTEEELNKLEQLFESEDNRGELFNSGSEAIKGLKIMMKNL